MKKLLIITLNLFFLISLKSQTVVKLYPTLDGVVFQNSTRNFNAENLQVGTTELGDNISLLKFDFSSIPSSARIQKAELKLTKFDNNYNVFAIFAQRVLSNWSSSTVTYSGINLSSTSYQLMSGYWTVDIKDIVQGFIDNSYSNYGIALKSEKLSTQSYRQFHSSESSAVSSRPVLEITYVDEPFEITSPISSTVWTVGQQDARIRWSNGGLPDKTVHISTNTGYVIATSTSNDGSYNWDIPSDFSPGNYRIRLQTNLVHGESGNTMSTESATFKIEAQKKNITINEPKLGDIWTIGNEYSILWDKGDVTSNVKIELTTSVYSNVVKVIASNVANNGIYKFTPQDIPDGNYHIKITPVDNSFDYVVSSRFLITSSTSFNISLVPNTNDQNIKIDWQPVNIGPLNIDLYSGSSKTKSIISNTTNTGSYLWSNFTGLDWDNEYQLYIYTSDNKITGWSSHFNLNALLNPIQGNFEITLYKVTSLVGGAPDTNDPGTDQFTFKEGETARFTFKVEYSSTEDITGIIAFEIFDPTGKAIYDSNPNNLKTANLYATEGEVKYFSIDWFVSYGGVYGDYGIGAALRDKDNFDILYDETYPGANTTNFETGWIKNAAFEIAETVNDVTPPFVEVYKTYQTGDGRLKVIAKITDANSGVNDNSIILKTRSYPGDWYTTGREVKMTPMNGFPGFFIGDSYQYESGNYILWQITAKDNKGNTFNYPKDIGYDGGGGYRISPQEIDPNFNTDWCLRVQIQDAASLQNQKYFHFTQKPSGAVTFKQSGNEIHLFNNTTIWYELESVPNITNKGTTLVDQIFHCLKPGKSGVLPTSFTDAFVNSPSFVIPGTGNINEVQLKLNRNSTAAIILNTFDMVYLSIKPAFPLLKLNEWVEIVANVIKDDLAFQNMAESLIAGNPEDASIKLLDWVISKSEFQNKIVQEIINRGMTDKPFDLVKQNFSRAMAVLTGINNRVQFLIDIFRYTDNIETITLTKSTPLAFAYETFPSSVNNNTGYRIFKDEAYNVNLLFNPIFDYRNIFKATAEIRIYDPAGQLIDVSQKNTLNTTGSFSASLESYDITSNGSFMKIANKDNMGVVFYHQFNRDMKGNSYKSTFKPYTMEIDFYEGGLPNETAPAGTSTKILSTGLFEFNIYDRVNPLKPEIEEISIAENMVGFSIRHKDEDIYKYKIFRKIDNETAFKEIAEVVNQGGQGSLFMEPEALQGVVVLYQIQALDISGNVSALSDIYTVELLQTSSDIVVSTTALSTFDPIQVGTVSGVKSYTVSGNDLTGNLTITAPSGFQISKSNSTGFGSTLSLTPTSGTVAPTTIYVWFNPTSPISYSGNISHTSEGAGIKNVAVSGTGLGVPEISVSTNTLSSFGSIQAGTTSGNKTYTVSGNDLTGNITITAPSGFQISRSSSSGFGNTISLVPNSGTVATTTIYVRFNPASPVAYSGDISHSSSGAETKNVAVTGTGLGAPEISVSTNMLSSFGPIQAGSTSENKTYTVSGNDLTGNITITAPSGFQISKSSNSGFTSTLSLTPTSETVTNTTIYVRFSPTSPISYSGNISHTSEGAESKNVAVSGTGLGAPEISVSTNTLSSFGSIQTGSVSGNKTYTVSGNYLKGNITISAPSGFQISRSNSSGFGNTISLVPGSGTVASTTIYVRFNPASPVAYSGEISHASSGAETKYIAVSGSGTEPSETAGLSIGQVNGPAGSDIKVPIMANNLVDIVGFQFTIVFDPTKLTYTGCSNWPSNISGVVISNPQPGRITFVYSDPGKPVNISSGKFFDIDFNVVANSGTTAITWSDNPTARSLVNSDLQTINCNYTDGSVSIISGYSLAGNLIYDNTSNTPLTGESISLINSSGQITDNIATDENGLFSFNGLANGNYSLEPMVSLPWGNSGVNVTDVLMYKQFIANSRTLSSFRERAGDVNGSGLPINVTDVLIIMRRLGDPSKTFPAGDWLFDNTAVSVNGANKSGHNILALSYGDANGSFVPATNKSVTNIFAKGIDKIEILPDNELEVPFRIDIKIDNLAAVGLTFSYPDEIFEVKDITMSYSNEDLYYTVIDGIIRIVFATLNSADQHSTQPLFTIRFKLKETPNLAAMKNSTSLFSGNGVFTDITATELNDVNVIYAGIDDDAIQQMLKNKEVKIYPNPANNFVNITNAENAEITLFDVHGRMVLKVNGTSNLYQLDLDAVNTGLYLISVRKDQNLINEKISIIKQ